MSKDNPYQGYHAQLLEKLDWLEHENVALKQRILDDNKAYGCELRDPSGTIWYHAKRLQEENAELREAKDAYFKHNNILVQLMTEEQKKKALDLLIKPTEAQP